MDGGWWKGRGVANGSQPRKLLGTVFLGALQCPSNYATTVWCVPFLPMGSRAPKAANGVSHFGPWGLGPPRRQMVRPIFAHGL